jgi:hypothetical protein
LGIPGKIYKKWPKKKRLPNRLFYNVFGGFKFLTDSSSPDKKSGDPGAFVCVLFFLDSGESRNPVP